MPRKVFVAGEILTAADVNTNLMDQAVMSFAGTAARGSAIPSPVEGMVTYLEDSDRWEGYTTSWGPIGGRILQIVRATDTTQRTSTSTSFADVTGMSVTITPKSTSSRIIVISTFSAELENTGGNAFIYEGRYQLTNSANTALAGAEDASVRWNILDFSSRIFRAAVTLVGYDEPNTTSATTYKLRFAIVNAGGNVITRIRNNVQTGTVYAIEVLG